VSGISVVLARKPQAHGRLVPVGRAAGLTVHRVEGFRRCCLRVLDPRELEVARSRGDWDWTSIQAGADAGDRLEFAVDPAARASWLVLGQAFHRRWEASVHTGAGWRDAATQPVDGFFQGVALPAGTDAVRLQFRPFVRHAWIGHAFFLALAVVLAGLQLWRRRAGAGGRDGSAR